MQNAYGRKVNAKLVMKGWENNLSSEYTGFQVAYAVNEYSKKHEDYPTPKGIRDILNPQEPEISDVEYLQACKEYERNNFNEFSNAYDIIQKYKNQKNQKRENFKIECEEIKKIVSQSYKQIEG